MQLTALFIIYFFMFPILLLSTFLCIYLVNFAISLVISFVPYLFLFIWFSFLYIELV